MSSFAAMEACAKSELKAAIAAGLPKNVARDLYEQFEEECADTSEFTAMERLQQDIAEELKAIKK